MKTLVVVRHAKSSAAEGDQRDFDRPLSERGKKDAAEMAKRLKKTGVTPGVFISSPAKRARKTCEAFLEAFDRKKDETVFVANLYHAPAETYAETVAAAEDKFDVAAIFGHNPGITDFVNTLCSDMSVEMPTCAVFAVKADVQDWSAFRAAAKSLLFYKYPKEA